MKRRNFILGSAALGGALASNLGISSLTLAQTPGRTKTIIKVFQRGGADGLFLFPPVGDNAYYQQRPDIHIAPPNGDEVSAIRLANSQRAPNPNGLFGLHPQFQPLQRIWEEGELMISPATHYDNSSRSHFQTQLVLEYGADGRSTDGFLNRYLQEVAPQQPGVRENFRGIRAGASTQAPVLDGDVSVPVLVDAASFDLESPEFCNNAGCSDNKLTEKLRLLNRFEADNPVESQLRSATSEAFDAITVTRVASINETNADGLEYSSGDLGSGLKLVSQLLKDGVPVEVAAVNWTEPGWDTHADQIPTNRSVIAENETYSRELRVGALDLLTFYLDMKNSGLLDDVIVIVGSEFGRTVAENGSRGTDHGFASTWFAFGGPTRGGVYNPYRNLRNENLEDGRFVPHLTSVQDIIGEAMARHQGVSEAQLRRIFPDHCFTNNGMFDGSGFRSNTGQCA